MLSRILWRGDWGVGWRLHVLTVAMVILLRTFPVLHAETVYFDRFGHCTVPEFKLDDDPYTVKAVEGVQIYETLICDLTFKSPPSSGICLTFREFRITDCAVTLVIYQQSTASGKQWKHLSCEDDMPAQMCTPERYVTLKLVKKKLNNNKRYEFDILIQKSTNLTGENVILASSIGLFVGIIAGVVALIAVLSVIVLCCCCKPCKPFKSTLPPPGYTATPAPDIRLHPPPSSASHFSVEPSAPPFSEMGEEFIPLQQGPALPPSYPLSHGAPLEQPPPYDPPPYEEHYPTKV